MHFETGKMALKEGRGSELRPMERRENAEEGKESSLRKKEI